MNRILANPLVCLLISFFVLGSSTSSYASVMDAVTIEALAKANEKMLVAPGSPTDLYVFASQFDGTTDATAFLATSGTAAVRAASGQDGEAETGPALTLANGYESGLAKTTYTNTFTNTFAVPTTYDFTFLIQNPRVRATNSTYDSSNPFRAQLSVDVLFGPTVNALQTLYSFDAELVLPTDTTYGHSFQVLTPQGGPAPDFQDLAPGGSSSTFAYYRADNFEHTVSLGTLLPGATGVVRQILQADVFSPGVAVQNAVFAGIGDPNSVDPNDSPVTLTAQPIPEPSSFLIFAVGSIGFGLLYLRRRVGRKTAA